MDHAEGSSAHRAAQRAEEPSAIRGTGHAPSHEARHGLTTVALPIEGTLDLEELAAAVDQLPADCWRLKGIARVVDGASGTLEPHLVAFHRVGARFSYEPLAGDAPTWLVALGPALDPAGLAALLSAARLA